MNALASKFDSFATNTVDWSGCAVAVDENMPEVSLKVDSGYATYTQSTNVRGETVGYGTVKVPHVVKTEVHVPNKASQWEAVLQSWEGRVVDVNLDKKEFTALIADRTNRNNPDELVEIEFHHVKKSDVCLISVGSVFYWNIGRFRKYIKNRLGPSQNHFEIRFRRLPPLSADKLKEIQRLSEGLASRLNGD